MKKITYTEKEIREKAFDAMERAVANAQVDNRKMAQINCGEASVWSEIYTDCTGKWLEIENEHYLELLNIYDDVEFAWNEDAEKKERSEMLAYMCGAIERLTSDDGPDEWWELLPEEDETILENADLFNRLCEEFKRIFTKYRAEGFAMCSRDLEPMRKLGLCTG